MKKLRALLWASMICLAISACNSDAQEKETTSSVTPEHYDGASGGADGYCDHCGVAMCVLGLSTTHVDRDLNCICEECGYEEHVHGQGIACGHCDVCGKLLEILDQNQDGICDLCGEGPCGVAHPHIDGDGDGKCDLCDFDPNAPITLDTPKISVTVTGEQAVLTIVPVKGAAGYKISLNGQDLSTTSETSYIFKADRLKVGSNEICVSAYKDSVYSEVSETVTVGKLGNPSYHSTGTGVEIINGDVENAQGYMIYGDDGKYLATIGLGGTFDFSSIYTKEGFYFPYIQACADGWISSEKCGIPVTIGNGGGPIVPN